MFGIVTSFHYICIRITIMSVIKIEQKVQSHTDQIEMVISILCFLNNIKLTKTQRKVLAFYVVYGIKEKTDQLIIKSGIVPKVDSLRNVKVKLHKLGFLKRYVGVYKSYELAISKDFQPDNVVTLLIKIDRS